MATTGIRIISIINGSPAENSGITIGSKILSINNKPVYDKLDFFYLTSNLNINIDWIDDKGKLHKTNMKKDNFEQDLGIEVENFKTMQCGCNCIFCFVHQQPKGLRKNLYIKDEDYRLSFFHGNYITGVNLTKNDLARIKKLHLSPLYLSIHTTSPELRKYMLRCKLNANPMPLLNFLSKAKINFHTQIVLCPKINDGEHLKKTVSDLIKFYPYLQSIAIVPVGLTKHRKNLPELKKIDSNYARIFLQTFLPIQREIKKLLGEQILFFSDEFYLLSDIEPPLYSDLSYLPQLENGVGMYAEFYYGYARAIKKVPTKLTKLRKIGVITSPLGAKVLSRVLKALAAVENLQIKTLVVKNNLFGELVTVTGLLSGKDILNTIKSNVKCDKYLIPGNALKYPEQVFLDDLSYEELKTLSPSNIELVKGGVKDFILECISD